MCVLTVVSLRGHKKGFYLDLTGIRKHIETRRTGVIPLGLNKSTVLTEEECVALPQSLSASLGSLRERRE